MIIAITSRHKLPVDLKKPLRFYGVDLNWCMTNASAIDTHMTENLNDYSKIVAQVLDEMKKAQGPLSHWNL